MLVKNQINYEPGIILSVKLVNGDELIGKLEYEENDAYLIQQPMAIVPTQAGIKLVNSMFTVEPTKTFMVMKTHVMLHNVAADPVADHYREVTTGIKTVRNESRIIL